MTFGSSKLENKDCMSNPFPSSFESDCLGCGDRIFEGDDMYAHDGQFMCKECADGEGVVCGCNAYKEPHEDECYKCRMDNEPF